MVELLYNQDIVTENYEIELLNKGIEQGIKQGGNKECNKEYKIKSLYLG